jgi:hypothetical protein
MRSKADRRLDSIRREMQRKRLRIHLRGQGRRTVYGAMLRYAIDSGSLKAKGYAANLFRELYGAYPRRSDESEPCRMPGAEIEEWFQLRPKPPKKKPAINE